MVYLTRSEHFNAAHKLYNPAWSYEKNEEVFGKCANENWHGHNYELEVKVIGTINPVTGYVIDLKILNDLIEKEVIKRFDHQNLNLDCPEFQDLNPTAEHICYVIWQILRGKLDKKLDLQVRLYETPRNYVEFPA